MTENSQISRDFTLGNQYGLHARPAALFVKTANSFKSSISVIKDGNVIDGKSVLGLLMLAAGPGTSLTVTASGADAEAAVKAIEELFTRNFGEN